MKFPTYEEMVEMAQNVAEKMLDEYEYKGKTLRQWIEIISAFEHGTNLAEVGTDCISREQAIEICDHAIDLLKGQFGAGALVAIKESIEELPTALPEPMKIDLSRCSEENWERIKKEWANTPITAITEQPYTIIDGRLFITVDDIEQVDCVLVAEYKSKFCREFWMADADEPARPERIKGHWVRNGWAITCSECGYDMPYTVRRFCPNCGADMRGEQDE